MRSSRGNRAAFLLVVTLALCVGFVAGRVSDPTAFTAPPRAGASASPNPQHAAPPARSLAALGYDRTRGRAILFGGLSPGGVLGDTWSWDGKTWTKLDPATSPPARQRAVFAWDAKRQVLVMFGGADSQARALGDTWTWGGSDWRAGPSTGPSPRWSSIMAFDPDAGRMVLYGGADGPGVPGFKYDTWVLDNSGWSLLANTGTMLTVGMGMGYTSAAASIEIFDSLSARDLNGSEGARLWKLSNGNWIVVASNLGCWDPGDMVAFDENRQGWILYGLNCNPSGASATGIYDATGASYSADLHPTALSGLALTYDADHKQMLAFGGVLPTATPSAETWAFAGVTWTQLG